jgi:twitching motility protein PilT
MAAIDALLKLALAQHADALVVASDRVPVLKKAGADVALSMPKVGHEMVAMFLEDLVDPEQYAALTKDGTVRTSHTFGEHLFAAELRREGNRYHLAFHLQKGAKAPAAAPAPAPARAPAPPPRAAPPAARPGPPPRPEPHLSVGTGPSHVSEGTDHGEGPAGRYRQPSANAGDLIELVLQAHREGASDVIVSAGLPVRVRHGGELREQGLVCDSGQILALAGEAWTDGLAQEFERSGSVDLALELAPGPGTRALRFRVNVFRQQRGVAAAVRPIRAEIPALSQLGLPDDLKALAQYPSGLVLMTGPTGSGKSTTLAALIEHVNLHAHRHVLTLEDPIEYQYVSKRALIHQREVGRDVDSFAAGLRAALREDPDIILLGEMRDEATIAAALTAAETGHLVLSTLHSGSAGMAIDRIVDVFPGHKQPQVRQQLAGSLRAVVTQALLPALRGEGRVPAIEKMIVTPAIASQIREGRGHQIATQIQTGRDAGMVSLEQSLVALVRAGRVGLDAALAVAPDPDSLRRALRG